MAVRALGKMTAITDALILSASLVSAEFLLVLMIFEGEATGNEWEFWNIPYRVMLFRKITLFFMVVVSFIVAKTHLAFVLQNKQYFLIILLIIVSYFVVVYQEAVRAAKVYNDRKDLP